MSHPSHDGHSDDDDGSSSRDRQLLPSFAQAFPSSPTITHPQLRNSLLDTPSASTSSSTMPPSTELHKRKRDEDSIPIKSEENEYDNLNEQLPPSTIKRQRSNKDSTSLSPPQPLHQRQPLPRSKHTLSGHSAALINESIPIASSSKPPPQTLPSTASFSVRRAAQSTPSSRKAAPSFLSINPPMQSSRKAKELGLEPAVRSAPPVPASRLRLHQLQSTPQPHVYQQATGTVPSISRVRFGATYETSSNQSKVPQPPKTAGLMGWSSHTSGGGGIQTVLQPPTPSTAGLQEKGRDANLTPLVPPTPSSLRHTLNQAHSRQTVQINTSTPAIAESRPGAHTQQSNAAAKQSFLQPFEAFYDSLLDARTLKDWLNDTMTRATALIQQQQRHAAGGSPNTRAIEEIVDIRLRGYKTEVDQLKERVSLLEDTLTRNGINLPVVGSSSGAPSVPLATFSRSNGSATHRSPVNKRDRELSIPSSSGNPPGGPYTQLLRVSSSSPSAQYTVLPPVSGMAKTSTSSSRLDPLPSRNQFPPVARGGRVPSPLGASPISEVDERPEIREGSRKSAEDNDDMTTTNSM